MGLSSILFRFIYRIFLFIISVFLLIFILFFLYCAIKRDYEKFIEETQPLKLMDLKTS